MKRAEREGGSSSDKKAAKKGKRQSNSRPPWCLPELESKSVGTDGAAASNPTLKENKQVVAPEPTAKAKDTHPLTDPKNDNPEGSKPTAGATKGEKKPFKVVEHLDLLSGSSSEDMDLDSDHESRPVERRESVDVTPAGAVEDTRKEEGGVSLGEGGPGTQLHWELIEYDNRSRLTQEQQLRREELIRIVTDAAVRVCPECQVMCFGSSANGLGTQTSDIDLVMVGVYEPDAEHGGFSIELKNEVGSLLGRVLSNLRRQMEFKSAFVIRKARIPLVKFTTMDNLDVDLSIGDKHGPKAAELLRNKVTIYPALRPLVLALKSLIKDKGLNEVVSGGLGTYALSNMVIVHLMELQQKGEHETDLGSLFVAFLERFGCSFNYEDQAVSIGRGGIVEKQIVISAGVVGAGGPRRDGTPVNERLMVEDYFTGRDVSSGTYRINEISKLFAASYMNLKDQFCVPPLPPGGPKLSTLSTLFRINNGAEKDKEDESLPRTRIDRYGKGKRKFEETDPKQQDQGKKKKKNKKALNNPSEKQLEEWRKPLKDSSREEFVSRIKSILKGI